jgi:predicted nucleic acid-binding protein
MTVVLDVSGAMEILFRTAKAERFGEVLQNAEIRFSSEMYIPELSNTLWKYLITNQLTKDQCLNYIDEGIKLVDHFIDSKELWQEAFHEAANHHHPVYDMFYAVAARRQSGTLITNDGPLANICKQLKIPVVFDIEA